MVISHIRRATQGKVVFANTQPFCRELGGRKHIFVHNGNLRGLPGNRNFPLGHAKTVGETDSEYAFCNLLYRLEPLWLAERQPTLEQRLTVVGEFAAAIRPLGPANFLYSDSEYLFAHGHRRTQRDGRIAPPGLFSLCRQCKVDIGLPAISGLKLPAQQEVLLLASVPLSEESWQPLAEGELLVLRCGTNRIDRTSC